jgi:hypothetical protein
MQFHFPLEVNTVCHACLRIQLEVNTHQFHVPRALLDKRRYIEFSARSYANAALGFFTGLGALVSARFCLQLSAEVWEHGSTGS